MIKNKIMIVSIDNEWLKNVSVLFNDNETKVYQSSSGTNAINVIINFQPQIIISDMKLLDMNGFKFLELINKYYNSELPIFIFYTTFATSTEIRTGMELGADDFIFNDISGNALLSSMEKQIEKRERLLADKNKYISELKNRLNENNNLGKQVGTSLDDYIFLDDKTNPGFYAVKDFVFISSDKDYTQIYIVSGKIITIHKTLTFWESFLPGNKFLRIHRQTIINLDYVKKVEKDNSYRFKIFLNGFDKPFNISQRYSKKIKTGWGIN